MTDPAPRLHNMHAGHWHPTAPVLLRDVWTLALTYRADPAAVRRWLPPGLDPHPDGRVEMTMYAIPDPAQTSGFGAFSLTYMTLEVADRDGYADEGRVSIPGRYWATYWNSSHRVRSFTREAVGIPAQPGSCAWHRDGDRLTSTLTVDGRAAITLEARTRDEHVGTPGGLLNYYTRRVIPSLDGDGAAVDELVHVPIPFICEAYAADPVSLRFDLPDGDPAAGLVPIEDVAGASPLYGKVTFTYSQAPRVADYLARDPLAAGALPC